MGRRKWMKRLRRQYGAVPDVPYFPGDMGYIRAYADYRREQGRDEFLLDDITWRDLDMDRIFQRINHGLSASGEQVLYYLLRAPALKEAEYRSRTELIECMENDPVLREKLMWVLFRLGRPRRADLCRAFAPESRGPGRLLGYLGLFFCFLAALGATIVSFPAGIPYLAAVGVFNSILHGAVRRKVERDFDTVNYSVSLIFALRRIRRLDAPALAGPLRGAYESLDRLRGVLRTGGVAVAAGGGDLTDMLSEAIATFTLLDLITYEYLKTRLDRCREDVFAIHEALGRLDAAIAVASCRKSLASWCRPEISFSPEAPRRIEIRDMVHPLLREAVPNDLVTGESLLITGSNASGKSTYLKAAALAVILAQSVGTCPARSYRAGAYRIYSSMALRDDLFAGESYYIVETRSLKRILDAAREHPNILCVVDEVLRGTNTVERIAASCEVLSVLAADGALCLAATHDVELCSLLAEKYRMVHFTERIEEDAMVFDYRLREGPASSRNAIELLRLMGFDAAIVTLAHARADAFLSSGRWER